MSAPQVSRRSVARGAAWSVPLVAVGVAAPAFAASGSPFRRSPACPAAAAAALEAVQYKPFRLNVTFTNASSTTTFTITDPDIAIVGDTVAGEALRVTIPAQTNTIPPGGTRRSATRSYEPSSNLDVHLRDVHLHLDQHDDHGRNERARSPRTSPGDCVHRRLPDRGHRRSHDLRAHSSRRTS